MTGPLGFHRGASLVPPLHPFAKPLRSCTMTVAWMLRSGFPPGSSRAAHTDHRPSPACSLLLQVARRGVHAVILHQSNSEFLTAFKIFSLARSAADHHTRTLPR